MNAEPTASRRVGEWSVEYEDGVPVRMRWIPSPEAMAAAEKRIAELAANREGAEP